MNEQQRFVAICNQKVKNMAWYAQRRASTSEEIWRKYEHFLGYIKALYDIGAIAEGRYWYYRSCSRGIVNKYAYEKEGKRMKTWYCVTSSFDDRGRVTAAITATRQAESKPEITFTSTRQKDIYCEWFESQEEALDYIEECKKA